MLADDQAALKEFNVKENKYLEVVGKGENKHLAVREIGWFGRILRFLCINPYSNTHSTKIAQYVNDHITAWGKDTEFPEVKQKLFTMLQRSGNVTQFNNIKTFFETNTPIPISDKTAPGKTAPGKTAIDWQKLSPREFAEQAKERLQEIDETVLLEKIQHMMLSEFRKLCDEKNEVWLIGKLPEAQVKSFHDVFSPGFWKKLDDINLAKVRVDKFKDTDLDRELRKRLSPAQISQLFTQRGHLFTFVEITERLSDAQLKALNGSLIGERFKNAETGLLDKEEFDLEFLKRFSGQQIRALWKYLDQDTKKAIINDRFQDLGIDLSLDEFKLLSKSNQEKVESFILMKFYQKDTDARQDIYDITQEQIKGLNLQLLNKNHLQALGNKYKLQFFTLEQIALCLQTKLGADDKTLWQKFPRDALERFINGHSHLPIASAIKTFLQAS